MSDIVSAPNFAREVAYAIAFLDFLRSPDARRRAALASARSTYNVLLLKSSGYWELQKLGSDEERTFPEGCISIGLPLLEAEDRDVLLYNPGPIVGLFWRRRARYVNTVFNAEAAIVQTARYAVYHAISTRLSRELYCARRDDTSRTIFGEWTIDIFNTYDAEDRTIAHRDNATLEEVFYECQMQMSESQLRIPTLIRPGR